MATSKDYSRSVTAASDELKAIYCEPCMNGGKQIEAEGFCVDCSEYLCGLCYKNHARYKAFRHHVLQDKDKMPVDITKAVTRDVCQEKCGIHQTKIIEYFCKSCDKLGCHACITINHRQCENVDHIPNIAKDLEQSEDFKEFINKLDNMLESINERKKKLSSNITETDEMKRKAKAELKKQREEINKIFDHLEAEMERRIENIDKNNKKNLKTAQSTCNSIGDDITQMKTTIDIKQKNGQTCELFIAIKNYKQKMDIVDEEFEKLRDGSKIQRYVLRPSTQLKEVLKNTTEICRLLTAKFVSQINIGTDNDEEEGLIYGLAVLQNHYLAVLDGTNKSVKMIDTRNMKVKYEMNMNCDNVWHITAVNDNQVAVLISSNCQRKIQFLSVSMSGSLSKGHGIDIDESYHCLAYRRGNFFMFNTYNTKVSITDMQGKTLTTINTEYSTNSIAVSPSNETIYLASHRENTVRSMTLDGQVKAVYKEDDLELSGGITVDSEGLVYVISSDSIHQLTEDCKKIQILLEDVYAYAITYSSTDNRLYIGFESDEIKVYQIE